MRTTINIDDALLKEVKAVALATDRTMAQVVEDALRESLASRKAGARKAKVTLPSWDSGGYLPGITDENIKEYINQLDVEADIERLRRSGLWVEDASA